MTETDKFRTYREGEFNVHYISSIIRT